MTKREAGIRERLAPATAAPKNAAGLKASAAMARTTRVLATVAAISGADLSLDLPRGRRTARRPARRRLPHDAVMGLPIWLHPATLLWIADQEHRDAEWWLRLHREAVADGAGPEWIGVLERTAAAAARRRRRLRGIATRVERRSKQ